MPETQTITPTATPVIIAGAPRSGTTFLTTALNTHPQVMITNELRAWNVFNDLRRRMGHPSESLPDHPLRERFKAALLRECAHMFEEFYRAEVTKDLLGCPTPIDTKSSVEPVIKAFGDKNPSYADTNSQGCLEFIAESLPDAKFIHIFRDPRACVASYLAIDVYSDELERCINVWLRHTQSMVKLRDALGTDRVLEIRYEDLVSERGAALMRRLEAHMNVDHADEPKEFLMRERSAPVPYRSPTTPVEKLGTSTWDERLAPDQVKILEESCGALWSMLTERSQRDIEGDGS